jgi:hypothetical protein
MAGTQSGFGISITFHSGFFAKILKVNGPKLKRASIDTSHAATVNGWMTAQPSDLKNPGEVSVDIQFNPNTAPPIDQPAESTTITFPIQPGGSTSGTWTGTGFMTDYEPDIPIDNKMTARTTLMSSGQWTFTPGS